MDTKVDKRLKTAAVAMLAVSIAVYIVYIMLCKSAHAAFGGGGPVPPEAMMRAYDATSAAANGALSIGLILLWIRNCSGGIWKTFLQCIAAAAVTLALCGAVELLIGNPYYPNLPSVSLFLFGRWLGCVILCAVAAAVTAFVLRQTRR